MNIKSKDFWLQVKEECHNSHNYSTFICCRSYTFDKAWHSNRELIMELATEFKGDERPEFCVERFVLFRTTDDHCYKVTESQRMKIRIDFIDWCIEKFD